MSEVQVVNITAGQALELKHQVQSLGLTIGQDFSWAYTPPVNNWSVNYNAQDADDNAWGINTNNENSGKVTFTFTDPAMASFFRIKWS